MLNSISQCSKNNPFHRYISNRSGTSLLLSLRQVIISRKHDTWVVVCKGNVDDEAEKKPMSCSSRREKFQPKV